jgi:hypothetical protein
MLRLIPATLAPNLPNFIDILKTPNEVKIMIIILTSYP